MRKSGNLFYKFRNLFRHETKFTFFFCDIYFNQYIGNNTVLFCFFINCFCESDRIYRMNQINFIDNVFYFITLHMPNHMPVNILWKDFIFRSQFLCFVFSVYTDSKVIGLLQHFYRFCFAYGDQSNFISFTSGTVTCSLYIFFYFFQIFF